MCGLALIVEFFGEAGRDLFPDFARIDRAVETTLQAERCLELTYVGMTAAVMFGYCSLQARRLSSLPTARCTCPSDAAAAASRSKRLNFFSHSGPSSAAILRRTKPAPIGGALVCSVNRGAATSGGNTPGTVATNCATFITGPRKLPNTCVRSAAFFALKTDVPDSERAAPRAATPVSPAETRAKRVNLCANPSSFSLMPPASG